MAVEQDREDHIGSHRLRVLLVLSVIGMALVMAAWWQWVGQSLRRRGLEIGIDVAWAVGGIMKWLLTSRGELESSNAVDERDALHAAAMLAKLAKDRLHSGEASWPLDDPYPIPVRWRITGPEVDDSWEAIACRTVTRASDERARMDLLAEKFRSMTPGRLVVLGGKSAGKTTLTVRLMAALLDSRVETDPVPMMVDVSEWDTERFPSLREWIVDQLTRKYSRLGGLRRFHRALRTLPARGMILPVLHGLDDLSVHRQVAIIVALNLSLREDDCVIIVSRSEEFIVGATSSFKAIEPMPIMPDAAAAYLAQCLTGDQDRRAWDGVLARLRSAPTDPLSEAASSPHVLAMLRAVYIAPQRDPSPLLDRARFSDAEALRVHLLNSYYLPTGPLSAKPGNNEASEYRLRKEPEKVNVTLGFLADQLTETGSRSLTWWKLAGFPDVLTNRVKVYLPLCAFLAAGGITWFAEWLTGTGVGQTIQSAATGAAYGIILASRTKYVCRTTSPPEIPWPRSGPAISLLCLAAPFALIMAWIDGGFRVGSETAAMSLILCFIAVNIVWRVELWASTSSGGPVGSVRAETRLWAAFIIPVVLVGTVEWLKASFYASASGHYHGLTTSKSLDFLLVIVCAFITWRAEWLAYLFARYKLAKEKRIGRRLMWTLDEVHVTTGVLRVVDDGYQFACREAREYFATMKPVSILPPWAQRLEGNASKMVTDWAVSRERWRERWKKLRTVGKEFREDFRETRAIVRQRPSRRRTDGAHATVPHR